MMGFRCVYEVCVYDGFQVCVCVLSVYEVCV